MLRTIAGRYRSLNARFRRWMDRTPVTNTRPPLLGYVRAHSLMCEHELADVKRDLAGLAERAKPIVRRDWRADTCILVSPAVPANDPRPCQTPARLGTPTTR